MIESNLRKLWLEGEGRLFLINLANQLDNGVIGPGVVLRFLERAANRVADFSSRGSALQYQREDPGLRHALRDHFKGAICDVEGDTLILRIAPFRQIIENVVFHKDGAALQAEIQDALNEYLNIKISDDEAMEAEKAIHDALNTFARGKGAVTHWSLPPQIASLGPVACSFGRRSLRFDDKAIDLPVFVAPVLIPDGSVVRLFDAAASGSRADKFRDHLGLDHLGSRYKDSRTVIGGVLLRASQLVDSPFHRPTPFDNTSKARFRGAHGEFGRARGSMGRAADLSKAFDGHAHDGCAELVAKDVHIESMDREVLIFYLGAVLDPRNDAYDEKVWSTRDDTFTSACLGEGHENRAIESILRAASALVLP